MKKTRAQLEAELEAANKRCADLADALVKQVMAQPVYYPVPYYPAPQYPLPTYPGVTWFFTNVCADGAGVMTSSDGYALTGKVLS